MLSLVKENTNKNTIAVLDGVRAVACLLVISYHMHIKLLEMGVLHLYELGTLAAAIFMASYTGVTLFFVLSGFLLFMPYAKVILLGGEWPSLRNFFLKRVLRIWPGYYLSLFLLIFIWKPQYLEPEHLRELFFFLTFTMDSAQSTYRQLNGPYWTLAVEWQFYVLLPFLALSLRWIAAHGSLKRRWWTLLACLVAMIIWGVWTRYWGWYYHWHPNDNFFISHKVSKVVLFFLYGNDGKYMEDFAVGMAISCCYVLAKYVPGESGFKGLIEGIRRYSMWLWASGILIWLFFALWDLQIWIGGVPMFPFLGRVFAHLHDDFYHYGELGFALGSGLCILAILFGPKELKRIFEFSPLRWIGLISYGIYIWHLPILFNFADRMMPFLKHSRLSVSYLLFSACVLLAVFPVSYAAYQVVELPWIKLAGKLRKKEPQRRQTIPPVQAPLPARELVRL